MNKLTLTAALLVAMLIGAGITGLLLSGHNEHIAAEDVDSNEPLYWVAPMDANFKRDKPGLSPMGMDLVPVYQDDMQDEK